MVGDNKEEHETAVKSAEKCSRCGLQIARPGSMTLWIFQEYCCSCAAPVPETQRIPAAKTDTPAKDPAKKILSDRYQLSEIVGRGGASVVYQAKDLETGQSVAIKLLRQDIAENEMAILRFQKEVRAAAELMHPNLGRIHGYGQDADGQPYIVMDLVEGENLAVLLKGESTLGVEKALNIFIQICEGLMYAHEKMVVHRDLTPSNIIVSHNEKGEVLPKIVDFGFAKIIGAEENALRLTQTGEVFGSPLYMSPEHCLGQELDVRSDIYSLGSLMYEALSGKPPLAGDNVLATVAKQVRENPVSMRDINASIPESIDCVVLKCLEKDPADRYQSVCDLMSDLQRVKSGKPIEAYTRTVRQTVSPGEASSSKRPVSNSTSTKVVAACVFSSICILLWAFFNQGSAVFDKTWSELDYQGQKEFDKGNYEKASQYFNGALKTAEFLPVTDKNEKLRMSLRELMDLSSATNDRATHDKMTQRFRTIYDRGTALIGQQYEQCKKSLAEFTVRAKAAAEDNKKDDLSQPARDLLQKCNELWNPEYLSLQNAERVFELLDRATAQTRPFLRKDDSARAEVMVNRAILAFNANKRELGEYISVAEQALREANDMSPPLKAHKFNELCELYGRIGDFDSAFKCNTEAINILRANRSMQTDVGAEVLLFRACLEIWSDRSETARYYFNQADFEFKKLTKPSFRTRQLYIETKLDLLAQAVASETIRQQINALLDEEERAHTNRVLLNKALRHSGTVSAKLNDRAQAIPLLKRSIAVADSDAEYFDQAYTANELAELYCRMGKYDDAINLFAQAKSLYKKLATVKAISIVAISNNAALVYMKQGKYEDAIKELLDGESMVNLPTFGSLKFKQLLYERLARSYEHIGDRQRALHYRQKWDETRK